ncbi:MAG: hypothetical protein K6D92_07890 [Erysipelotrichaceae bacterium]|jgi:hypothetical protein|nr:hypothetical protein [Erysipelotrichaceae bacterium]MCR5300790.1 hypothetical protein [Erysipelotrichaceae bacterium]
MEFAILKLIQPLVFFDIAPDPVTQTLTAGGIIAILAVVVVGIFGIFKLFKKKG